MRRENRNHRARAAVARMPALLLLLTLLAACSKDVSTTPGAPAALALEIRWPAAAPAQQVDSIVISAFNGNARAAGPVEAAIDEDRRTFTGSIEVPPDVPLTITVEAVGVFSFPDESQSERGVIFFGQRSGVTASAGNTAVEVPLDPFVPGEVTAVVELDGLAHIRWSAVPGASAYQLAVQHANEPPQILTIREATAIICDLARLGSYACRVRAMNTFSAGAFSDSVRTFVPPCSAKRSAGVLRVSDAS